MRGSFSVYHDGLTSTDDDPEHREPSDLATNLVILESKSKMAVVIRKCLSIGMSHI